MTSFAIFYNDMKELVDAKSHEEYLRDRISKCIKEVFRDAGYHCKQITITQDGFSCIGQFSEIAFDDLKKINDFFEDYSMSVFFHNTFIGFKFNQK